MLHAAAGAGSGLDQSGCSGVTSQLKMTVSHATPNVAVSNARLTSTSAVGLPIVPGGDNRGVAHSRRELVALSRAYGRHGAELFRLAACRT